MAECFADQGNVQKAHHAKESESCRKTGYSLFPDPCSLFLHIFIEFPRILAYAKDADEFVRLSCRDHTGWRRDEWAYGPLFICGKFPRFSGYFPRFLARNRANPVGPWGPP
jgi:hypothetical protein